MREMVYLKVQNKCECILQVESRKYRKNRSMSVFGGAICKSRVLSLVGWGLLHMQISASQNWYKRSNLSMVVVVVVALLLHSRTGQTSVLTQWVKETGPVASRESEHWNLFSLQSPVIYIFSDIHVPRGYSLFRHTIHVIHVAFPLSFVYLKTQMHPVFETYELIWPVKQWPV